MKKTGGKSRVCSLTKCFTTECTEGTGSTGAKGNAVFSVRLGVPGGSFCGDAFRCSVGFAFRPPFQAASDPENASPRSARRNTREHCGQKGDAVFSVRGSVLRGDALVCGVGFCVLTSFSSDATRKVLHHEWTEEHREDLCSKEYAVFSVRLGILRGDVPGCGYRLPT